MIRCKVGDLVEYQGQIGLVVAHKLYDAKRDGYLVRFSNDSHMGTELLLPSEVRIIYIAKNIENPVDMLSF